MGVKDDIIKKTYAFLTGGRKVDLEIDPAIFDIAIQEAFEKVKMWYYEPRIALTVPLIPSGDSYYVNKSDLKVNNVQIPVRRVCNVYPVTASQIPGGTSIDAKLFTMNRDVLFSQSYVELAYYSEFAKMVENFMSTGFNYHETADKILISGQATDNTVTVVFYPDPQNVEQVTVTKAQHWMDDYVIAFVQHAVGRVRSKFASGDLNLETDGADLAGSARDDLKELEEKLKDLDVALF